jgi:hypothetical protein
MNIIYMVPTSRHSNPSQTVEDVPLEHGSWLDEVYEKN